MCDSAEGVKPLSMGRLVQRTLNLIIKNEAEIVERGRHGIARKQEGCHVWINQPLRTQQNLLQRWEMR